LPSSASSGGIFNPCSLLLRDISSITRPTFISRIVDAMESADQVGDRAPHLRLIEVFAPFAERNQDLRRRVPAPLADCQDQLEELLLRRARNASDHPEIDERDASVWRQQHVSRMRIGVEHAVDQNLLQIGAEEILGERDPVHFGPFHAADRGDLGPRDIIHRQHSRSCEVVDWQRHDDMLEVAKLVSDRHEVACLLAIIEFRHQRPFEFIDDACGVHIRCSPDAIDDRGDFVKCGKVLFDLLVDAGSLYFDSHFAAAAQNGPMHLPERCGGDRELVELDKRMRHPNAEFLSHDPLDVFVRKWLDLILQTCERVEISGRQQVGPGRENLAQLDECRSQRLEVPLRTFRRHQDRPRACLRHSTPG
jgi:hypothetical protein